VAARGEVPLRFLREDPRSLDPGPPALAIPAFDVEAVGRMHVGVDLQDEEGTAAEAVDRGEDDAVAGLDVVVHGPSISFPCRTLHGSADLRQLFDGDVGGAVGVPRQFQLRSEGLPEGVLVDLDDPPGTAVGPNLLNQVADLDVLHGSTLSFRGGTLHSEGRDADDVFASLLVDLTFLDGQDLDRGALVVLGVVVTVKDVHVTGELLELCDEPGHRAPLRLLGGDLLHSGLLSLCDRSVEGSLLAAREERGGGLLRGGLLGSGLHGPSIPFRG